MPVKNKGTNERTNEQTKKHDECTSKRVLNKFNIDVYLLSPNSQKKKSNFAFNGIWVFIAL